jgi:SAM-dependent methyltransferase
MSETNPYFLGYRPAEQERLERQAHELATDSAWLFNQIQVRQGWQALEVGCGPHGCLDLLAERVGPSGHVIGIERSAEQVVRARQFIAEKRFTNIDVLHADARHTGLPENAFDLVTARLVLVNVPEPELLVYEMARLCRAGGVVALHEPDSTTQRCDPAHPAQMRLLQLLNTYAELHGIDRTIGLSVPRLLRDAGLVNIEVNALVHVYPVGHGRRMLLLEFVENTRSGLLERHLVEEGELNELIAELKQHLEDPATLVLSSVFIQAWGHKPT